jgi:hypothetical protein
MMSIKTFQQGEIMKKSYLTIALTLTSLLGLDISARAQDANRITVTVPFEFVAEGHTMPAGAYEVSPVSNDSRSGIAIRRDGNTLYVLPIVFDEASVEQAKLNFEHVGGKYFLSKVETAAGIYTIATPRAITRLARSNNHGTGSPSGN